MSLPSNKDAAADQYKKDAWKGVENLNTTNGQLSLNFQVAQPHRVCQSCLPDKIRHAPHSLEEKLSLNAHQNSHKVARFFEDSRYRAGQYEKWR